MSTPKHVCSCSTHVSLVSCSFRLLSLHRSQTGTRAHLDSFFLMSGAANFSTRKNMFKRLLRQWSLSSIARRDRSVFRHCKVCGANCKPLNVEKMLRILKGPASGQLPSLPQEPQDVGPFVQAHLRLPIQEVENLGYSFGPCTTRGRGEGEGAGVIFSGNHPTYYFSTPTSIKSLRNKKTL